MDFIKSHFGKMQLWPVEHFWLTFFQISTDLEKNEPKVFNWSELHLSEVTSYKVHILAELIKCRFRTLFYEVFTILLIWICFDLVIDLWTFCLWNQILQAFVILTSWKPESSACLITSSYYCYFPITYHNFLSKKSKKSQF